MHNYIAVVFDNTSKAYEGLHALWQLDDAAEITVHGSAVVHRDATRVISRSIPRRRTLPWLPPLVWALALCWACLRDRRAQRLARLGEPQSVLPREARWALLRIWFAQILAIKRPVRPGSFLALANLPSLPT